jgi:hypothetical protein
MSELLDYCILKDTFVLNNINDFIYLNNWEVLKFNINYNE